MWYHQMILLPVLIPTLVVESWCDNNTDASDVIVQYSGHAEANFLEPKVIQTSTVRDAVNQTDVATAYTVHNQTPKTTTTESLPDETEGVLFIPNDAPIIRLEDQYNRTPLRLEDVMMKKNIDDVMMEQSIRVETESPHDIVFIASKNNDYTERSTKEIKQNMHEDSRRSNKKREKVEQKLLPPKLDCSSLDCNNTINSLCGGKEIKGEMRYRLFLNECYYRKVNCNFKFGINRYTIVSSDKCKKVGAHYAEKPFSFKRRYMDEPKLKETTDPRRSFSSRRSMSVSMNGEFCSHPCPISCPDNYEPECALSATGQRKVFMNHCKLDDNSCLFGVVWHKRPLSECVGGQKADLRQNRYFIDWMQRIGIVDPKGRLVLE